MSIKKIKNLISFVFLLLPVSIFSIDHIEKEYPELKEFFQSEAFQQAIGKLGRDSINTQKLGKQTIAANMISIGTNGFNKGLIFNSDYVDNHLFSADELKFVICHELGHLNDNRSYSPLAGISFASGCFGMISALKAIHFLFQNKWIAGFKKSLVASSLLCATGLILMKLARDGEYFAGSYALAMTKNKEAACNALIKRKQYIPEKESTIKIISFFKHLFDDHPSTKERINYIRNQLISV